MLNVKFTSSDTLYDVDKKKINKKLFLETFSRKDELKILSDDKLKISSGRKVEVILKISDSILKDFFDVENINDIGTDRLYNWLTGFSVDVIYDYANSKLEDLDVISSDDEF